MSSETLVIVLFVFVFLLLLLLLWQQRSLRSDLSAQSSAPSLEWVSRWLQDFRESLLRSQDQSQQQMHRTQQAIGERLDHASHLMHLLNRDLGQIQEIGGQIRDFQQLFRSPKLRGRLGEQLLADILFQVFPRSNVQIQHRFRNGQIVDALLQTEKGAISIDAKFPLENFQRATAEKVSESQAQVYQREFIRDVRRHISSIQQKYIQPGEGTLDFAVMYIPSEAVSAAVLDEESLVEQARAAKVFIASPNSFYYLLHTVLLGLETSRIEKNAQQLIKLLQGLRQDFAVVNEDTKRLNTHLGHARSAGERLQEDLFKVQNRIESMRELDGPMVESEPGPEQA